MPTLRRAVVTVVVSATSAVTVHGCDRANDASRTDSVTLAPPPAPAVDSQPAPTSSGWDAAAGPVLLVAHRPEAAIVVFPDVQGEHAAAELRFDTTALRGSTVSLVGRSGSARTAMLGDPTGPGEEEDCVGWPMLHVALPAGSPPSPWSIGFLDVRVTPIALDSAGSLTSADSSVLVADIARLASAVPLPATDARFRGLPFSVQDIRRFRTPTGTDIVVAQVIRRVHEEANPLEERTTVIAERDSTLRQEPSSGRYTLAFHQRTVGREETLEGSELLAAFSRHGANRPLLVMARESEGGVRYVLLERTRARSWKVKWTSALVRC
jgi:hypothetical protein